MVLGLGNSNFLYFGMIEDVASQVYAESIYSACLVLMGT